MKERSVFMELIRYTGMAVFIWGSGAVLYGLVEVLTNFTVGLYLPLNLLASVLLIYALFGVAGGTILAGGVFAWQRLLLIHSGYRGGLRRFLGGAGWVSGRICLNQGLLHQHRHRRLDLQLRAVLVQRRRSSANVGDSS